MAERFYTNLPLSPGPFTLDGPEAHHLAHVRRIRPGDPITLFNGDGRDWAARAVNLGKRHVEIEVVGCWEPNRELPFQLEVAAALPKGDRAQFLVEKLTEVGVTAFVPLDCERSVVRAGEAKVGKLERYVIEASKQCGRNVLMKIGPSQAWANYVLARPDERRWIAHPQAEIQGRQPTAKATSLRVAIGPEGGYTDGEVAAALANGWEPVSLGPRILRVETAAIALALLAQANRAST